MICYILYQVALGRLGVTLSLYFWTEIGFLPNCPQLGSWLVVELRTLELGDFLSTPRCQLGSAELCAFELREAFCQLCILNSVTGQVLPLADIFGFALRGAQGDLSP